MFKLKADLKPGNAVAKGYPLIANKQQGANSFDWNNVLGYFVKYSYRINVTGNSLEKFKNECEKSFKLKLDEPEFWNEIQSMYFQEDDLYEISPELLLFKLKEEKSKSPASRLGQFFLNLLQDFYIAEKPETKLNFLEREIVATFNKFVVQGTVSGSVTDKASERPFLPFLSEVFAKDLAFLNSKPKYFLNSITDFLRLYVFLYTTQLAINLGAWKQGQPKSMKCFFIVDNERASEERTWVKDFGYKQFESSIQKVFPYLSMSESLQETNELRWPLWELAQQLNESHADSLNNYAQSFAEKP
ncbi:DNA phosphorothioation-dependent restriction protein DptG [Psychrosphaera haliotis]|uniref:DNA phosphorothioation-dependent restriction protein DptG n=1 Tax=Psychrosphaera haliotis TaxID=555083 RepID=UPI0022AA5BD7|nr:DNA phosphorothioation-dependent restriction protein DptG [Psychrosphaera haliotis]